MKCTTQNVIYCLECPCGLQYIGKMNRNLKENYTPQTMERINKHVRNIEKGVTNHSVSRHFNEQKARGLKFWGISIVQRDWRGGDIVRGTLQEESKWIHKLQTFTPQGLNIDINLRAFL
ncbi:hypothetical protein XELAEV_18000549mg [Xenopus laevis]|nr:hypothetical protein XELAEV_18000549mg [Xenopus laevis]